MDFIDTLISKLAPHVCLGCGQEGTLLCSRCGDILSDPAVHSGYGNLRTIRAVTTYEGFAGDLVQQLKFRGSRAAAGVMAGHMASLVQAGEDAVVVPVPTATRRIRQRGFDQSRLLARQLCRRTGLAYMDCLRRHGQTRQVGASRQVRLRQLQDAFSLKKRFDSRNRTVILVDDVVTTGATLEAAAAAIGSAGPSRIDAIVFAQAA